MLNETDSKKKAALRQEFLSKRRLFVQSKGSNLDQVHSQLVDSLEVIFPKTSGIAATYFPTQDEANPNGVSKRLSQWQFAYPRVEEDQLTFWIPEKAQAFLPGALGINEPIPEQSQAVSLGNCRVVLVPGVAFDKRGGRIGYGKGFYDRALRNCQGLKIGIGYTAQISMEDLPVNGADVYMDWVVTEKFVIERNQAKQNWDGSASRKGI